PWPAGRRSPRPGPDELGPDAEGAAALLGQGQHRRLGGRGGAEVLLDEPLVDRADDGGGGRLAGEEGAGAQRDHARALGGLLGEVAARLRLVGRVETELTQPLDQLVEGGVRADAAALVGERHLARPPPPDAVRG